MSEANFPRAQTPGETAPFGSVSLSDLVALNDEIIALTRAGVPLERGLSGVADDLPGRFKRITADLSDRLARGESLSAAMAAQPQVFPAVYRALVEAGLRCGRLAPVLEGLAGSVNKLRDVRQTVLAALIYPLGVMVLASVLFVFMVIAVLPKIAALYDGHPPAAIVQLMSLGERYGLWAPIVPLAVILIVGLWWYQSSRAMVLQRGGGGMLLGMPGVRSLMTSVQAASLADVLALLLEQGVPLHDAVTLAADAVGDQATRSAAQALAASNMRGSAVNVDTGRRNGLTPFLHWLIASGQNERTLVPLVRHTGLVYRQRALRQADWMRIYLPAILTVAIGGTATFVYVLSLFVPYTDLLKDLAHRL